MKRTIYIILLGLATVLFTTCEKFETNPLTKIKTISVSPSVVTAMVTGKIIDISGKGNDDYGFCYANHENPTVNDGKVSAGNPEIGDFFAQIENLTPGLQYHVRAYCKDDNGYVYGDALPFSTFDGVIAISTNAIVYVSSFSARIEVSITDDGGADITARGVCWSKNSNPTIDNSFTNDGVGIGDFISIIPDLQPYTTLFVKAYATNIAGTFYGNELTFTTLEDGVVFDADGNQYGTIMLNEKEWFAENLKVTIYQDGTPIANGLNDSQWENTTSGAYAIYPYQDIVGIDDEEEMACLYGLLYNWYAVNDSRGLCPLGWRLPTDEEWLELIDYIEGENDGNILKSCLQVNSPLGGECATSEHPRWDPDDTHYGTDEYGFAALPSGFKFYNGAFLNIGKQGSWWCSTDLGVQSAWYWSIYNNSGTLNRSAEDKNMGLSVRCIKEWE
jgi:uncharacterized protein (TIGR02145 family)